MKRYPHCNIRKRPDDGQNAFAVYLNGTGWIGSLNALDNLSMYIYRGDQADTPEDAGCCNRSGHHANSCSCGLELDRLYTQLLCR